MMKTKNAKKPSTPSEPELMTPEEWISDQQRRDDAERTADGKPLRQLKKGAQDHPVYIEDALESKRPVLASNFDRYPESRDYAIRQGYVRERDRYVYREAKPPLPQIKPWSVNNFDSGLTRLQVGDIVDLGVGLGGHHIVWKCSDCRALCIPLSRREVNIGADRELVYSSGLKAIGISPNSEVPILQRLGKSGMITFLENRQKEQSEISMSKETKTAKKTETENAPKLGRLGGFHGFAITAVIRAMAVAGWEYWEIRNVFDAEKIPVADNTIRIQLSAGRAGKGGAPATLSKKALAELRPDASEKPAAARQTAAKKGKPAKAKKAAKEEVEVDDVEEDEADEDEAPAPKSKKKSKPAPAADEDEEEEVEVDDE